MRFKFADKEKLTKPVDEATAKAIGEQIGLNWDKIDLEQFRMGLEVELEHTDVTGGDPEMTGKIAAAHLREMSDYYDRLKKMEADAEQ